MEAALGDHLVHVFLIPTGKSGHLCHSSGLLCSFQSHVALSQSLTHMNQLNSLMTVTSINLFPSHFNSYNTCFLIAYNVKKSSTSNH